jgi:hypothetical protein
MLMRDRSLVRIPAEIEAIREKFETWRRKRTGQERIPESLWSEAVEVARRCGIWPTAKALRLDYNKLKQRTGASRERQAANPSTAFVEVIAPEVGVISGIVEMENGRGARMRIEWKGGAADLVALSRTFWGEGA